MISIPKASEVFNKNIFKGLYDYSNRLEVYYGGASSGKSHGVYQKVIFKALKFEKPRRILVIRKIGSSLRDSSFQHIKEILEDLKILKYCRVNKTDLTIKLPNNAFFIFKGLDDPEKIKSIKGISDIVMEEATEFTLDDFTQLSIRLRDDYEDKQMFLMFNPVSKVNWVYDYFFLKDSGAKVFHSTYSDNDFLDDITKSELEKLKERNPAYYRIYALGEFATLDKLVFPTYKKELIDDNLIKHLPLYVGLDFGYINDPSAVVWLRYDKDNKIIYITGEYVKKGMLNDEIADKLIKLGLHKEQIIADSAEPKSIDEIKRLGVYKIKSAIKGKDSIIHGIQWIGQNNIIVDERCFKTIEELENYTWKKDKKTGEYINEPNDAYNHIIDAVRYALNDHIKGKTQVTVMNKRELGL